MQHNRESGFYNPRVFLAFVLCFGAALLALVGLAAPTPPAPKQAAQTTGFGPTVSRSVFNSVSAPVSNLPKIQLYMPRAFEEDEGLRKIRPDHPVPPNFVDAALQRAFGRSSPLGPLAPEALPAPLVTFDGVDATEACGSLCLPPDPNGAVGPNQYVEMVNTAFSVYDKAGVRLSGPTAINELFTALPANSRCRATNDGDPVVVYDQLADRWLLSQFAVRDDSGGTNGPYEECIAISQTSDATGAYYVYDFALSTTKFEDYPHIGLWPDGYYMSTHQFNQAGTAYVGAAVWAFERDKMLLGQPAQLISFDLGSVNLAFGGHLPANVA